MLSRLLSLAILLPIALHAADDATESKLIGEWNISFLSSVTRISFRRDHTCTIWRNRSGRTSTEVGRWDLAGDRLTIRYKGGAFEVLVQQITDKVLEVTIPEDTWAVWARAK